MINLAFQFILGLPAPLGLKDTAINKLRVKTVYCAKCSTGFHVIKGNENIAEIKCDEWFHE